MKDTFDENEKKESEEKVKAENEYMQHMIDMK